MHSDLFKTNGKAIFRKLFNQEHFRRMWKKLEDLKSPFVVKFFDSFLPGDTDFYVLMEHVESDTLTRIIDVLYIYIYILYLYIFFINIFYF